jgi:hypothetical protein
LTHGIKRKVHYPKGIDGQLDRAFSKLVRESADYVCQNCNKQYRHDTRLAHCAHVHSRKHRATRWHVDGAICLCASCHRRYTDFPIEWTDFVRRHLGDERSTLVCKLAHTIRKYTKAEKQEMLVHYRAQFKYLERRRMQGETGYIEFVGYD